MQRPLEHMKKEPLHRLPGKCKTRPVTAQTPRNSPTNLGSTFLAPQWILTDQFLSRRALADPGPFVLAICSRRFPRRAVLLLTLMKRFLLRAKQRSYLQPDIWGSEAVRQSGRDSLHSHRIPTESWEDSGRPCSEIPLIHRSDRLEERRWMVFIRLNSGSTVPNLQAGGIVQRTEAARLCSQDCRRISTIPTVHGQLKAITS